MAVKHDEVLLRNAYSAFNKQNIDVVMALMHPDVDWANGMEGGRFIGHQQVRDYWTRQFGMIKPTVTPTRISFDDQGKAIVEVHQLVHDLSGQLLSDTMVKHIYQIEQGLIKRMDID